jgi:ribosomal protein S18 acetylase RimI-like enzyme
MPDSSFDSAIGPEPINPLVRPAQLREIALLEALDDACFPLSDPVAQRARPGEIAAGVAAGRITVAICDGRIAGFIHSSPQGEHETFVENIAVAVAVRGRGIGRILLDAILVEAQTAGRDELVACTVAPSNIASLALFVGRGFRVVSFLPAYYGPGKDRLRLERAARHLSTPV